MRVVLETPIEGESTTEVVLGICQVFNICVRVCVLMDATRARRSPGTGVWLTSEWRWWRSKQEGGGPEAGGALPTVRDAVVKLYRYVVGDGDEALSTCVVMSLLRIDGSELEHVDTRHTAGVNPTAGWSLIIFSGVSWHISDLSITPRYLLVV